MKRYVCLSFVVEVVCLPQVVVKLWSVACRDQGRLHGDSLQEPLA